VTEETDKHRARELFAQLEGRFDGDPALARRVADALERITTGRSSTNRRNPAIVDPFEIYRADPLRLQPTLEALDVEQLKDIVAQYGMDARRLAMKWKSTDRLIDLIVQIVDQRARKGEAFLGAPVQTTSHLREGTLAPRLAPLGGDSIVVDNVTNVGGSVGVVHALPISFGVTNVGNDAAILDDVAVETVGMGKPKVVELPVIPKDRDAHLTLHFEWLHEVKTGNSFSVTIPYHGAAGRKCSPLTFEARYLPPGRWVVQTRGDKPSSQRPGSGSGSTLEESKAAFEAGSDLFYWQDQILSRGHALIRRLEKETEDSSSFPPLSEDVRDYVGEVRGPAVSRFNAGSSLFPRKTEQRLLSEGGAKDFISVIERYVAIFDPQEPRN
jgi:hypothetical protein